MCVGVWSWLWIMRLTIYPRPPRVDSPRPHAVVKSSPRYHNKPFNPLLCVFFFFKFYCARPVPGCIYLFVIYFPLPSSPAVGPGPHNVTRYDASTMVPATIIIITIVLWRARCCSNSMARRRKRNPARRDQRNCTVGGGEKHLWINFFFLFTHIRLGATKTRRRPQYFRRGGYCRVCANAVCWPSSSRLAPG